MTQNQFVDGSSPGEAANIVKKIRRRDNDPDLVSKLADELADLSAYIDLLAYNVGIDLEKAIENKYNRLSQVHGSPTRIVDGELIACSFAFKTIK